MKLKEMENTGVIINTRAELKWYLELCEDAGWEWCTNSKAMSNFENVSGGLPTSILAKNKLQWDLIEGAQKLITLAEFKKEQGIMKYSVGDVLVSRNGNEKKVQGVCGEIYFMSHSNNLSKHECGYSDSELEEKGWSLKVEIASTNMTVSEIEKALGKAAGSLNVVAE